MRVVLSLGVSLVGFCADVVGRLGLLAFVNPPFRPGEGAFNMFYFRKPCCGNVRLISRDKTLHFAYILAERKFTENEFRNRECRQDTL